MKDNYIILKDCTPSDLQYAVNKWISKGFEPCGPLIEHDGNLLQMMQRDEDFEEVEEPEEKKHKEGHHPFMCPKCGLSGYIHILSRG